MIYSSLLHFNCSAFSQTDFIEHYNYTGSFQYLGRESSMLVWKYITTLLPLNTSVAEKYRGLFFQEKCKLWDS